jgi:predicted  nucleic acid-binding Zn-ribbon protein
VTVTSDQPRDEAEPFDAASAREARFRDDDRARIRELNARLLELEAREAELVDLRERFRHVDGSYRLLVEEHLELVDEYNEFRDSVAKEIDTIDRVYKSFSWRITKPLRALKGAGRRSAS